MQECGFGSRAVGGSGVNFIADYQWVNVTLYRKYQIMMQLPIYISVFHVQKGQPKPALPLPQRRLASGRQDRLQRAHQGRQDPRSGPRQRYRFRHAATIPTLRHLIGHNPKSIVLLSHLGRPNGTPSAKHSLRPVVEPLQQLLGKPVTFL